ncbi:MAG: hypothetical protein ACRBCS_07410 [Cellvibrionaceae bacterium]
MNITTLTKKTVDRYRLAMWQMVTCLRACDTPVFVVTPIRHAIHPATVGLKGNRVQCVS